MSDGVERVCVWSGIAFLVPFFIGLLFLAGFVPPPSAALDAKAIADVYAANTAGIRVGLILGIFASGFFIPWSAVIAVQMMRMRGASPVLAIVEAIGGGVAIFILQAPLMMWLTAAFRPERDPALVQLLNDLGWLTILVTFSAPMLQVVAVGLATLLDSSDEPIYPRWAGYMSIWAGFAFFPGVFIEFLKTGAFAWNGLIGFWIPFAAFGGWIVMMTPLVRKAAARAG